MSKVSHFVGYLTLYIEGQVKLRYAIRRVVSAGLNVEGSLKVLREGGAEEFHFIFHLTFASVVFTELCGVWAESDFEIFQIVGGGVKK